jgi:hypothetical protein
VYWCWDGEDAPQELVDKSWKREEVRMIHR